MYNTEFQVRYHEIETALLVNLQKMMEKKIAIANGTYIEEMREREKKTSEIKAKQVLPDLNTQPASILCANCANCTCGANKKGKEKKAKEPKPKKETKKEKKAREDAEKIKAAEDALLALEKEEEQKQKQLVVEENLDESDDEELEYTLEDVHIICDKLYRDELLSVFNVTSTEDENMDAGIKSAIEQMINNQSFRNLLDDIKTNLVDFENFTGTPEEMDNMKRNTEYLIFITLFSQKLFYLTHICLCQLFTVGEIDPNLLLKIKEKTIDLFKPN